MKKIICLLIIMVIALCSCQKKPIGGQTQMTMIKEFYFDETQQMRYSSVDDQIDTQLFLKIQETYQKIIENHYTSIHLSCESYWNEKIISYLVHFYAPNMEMLKAYHFDLKSKQPVQINSTQLKKALEVSLSHQFTFDTCDMGLIQTSIQSDGFHVYLSPLLMKGEKEEIILPYEESWLEKEDESPTPLIKPIALTFDDGPSAWSKELVDLLADLDIVATFFVLGGNVERYPSELKYIASHGHEIGNHSYNHPDFKKLTLDNALLEIEKTQQIVYETIHKYPRLFRFPYGSVHKEVLHNISLRSILWTADSLDWQCYDSQWIIERMKKEVKENGILLFHDFKYCNQKAIVQLVKDLKAEGYTFVTVSELLGFYVEEDFLESKNYF
ncbi:MAG: polysaccharide deacetylase family protein [Prevotella sp.]|nr:polysaccharide deacetylase family protein [Staphylococcus sp.]MCM1349681.1 polysaccharide deacetylase family protein [Prevotella sp.]